MQKAPNRMTLIVLLAALIAVSAVLFHHVKHIGQETPEARFRKQLEIDREQVVKDDAAYREEEFQKHVEALRKKSHAYAGIESKTWNSNKP